MKKILLTLTLVSLSIIKAAPVSSIATLTISNPHKASITAALHKLNDPKPKGYASNKQSQELAACNNSNEIIYNIPLKTSRKKVLGKNEYETLIKIQTKNGIIREYSIEAQKCPFPKKDYSAIIRPDGSLLLMDTANKRLSEVFHRKGKRPNTSLDLKAHEGPILQAVKSNK